MYKGHELLGKPIVAMATGEIIEKVSDLIIDHTGQKVLALLADEGGLFASAKIIPFAKIQSVGPDAVMVATSEAMVPADQEPLVEKVLDAHQKLIGLKVMTESGQDLGTIKDLYFSKQTGAIEGYEVSDGMAADMKSGRSFLPAPKTLKIGKDVAIVPDETATLFEEQVGGLEGVAKQAGQKARGAAHQMKQKAGELAGTAKTEAHQAGQKGSAYADRTREMLEGSKGEIQQGWQEVQETAGVVWDKLKEKTSTLRDQTAQDLEERRIKAALGRPTDRIILDKDDTAILERGEIITNKAIQQAREAGVLDMLLGSVGSEEKVGA